MSDNNNNNDSKILVKKVAVTLFYIMFIYSGCNKIINFSEKVNTLTKKLHFLPKFINIIGMICVILLEIIGSFIIIIYAVTFLGSPASC